jgi:hypothetical protein
VTPKPLSPPGEKAIDGEHDKRNAEEGVSPQSFGLIEQCKGQHEEQKDARNSH